MAIHRTPLLPWGLGFQIAKAEFKLRNEGSYLGIFWYLLNPLLMFGLLFFIFNDRLGADIPFYPLYLLLGILLFNFFQSTTLEATRSIISEHHHLIKSIHFKRQSLVLAIILKNLFSHCFEIILFSVILIFAHGNMLWMLSYIPLLALFSTFIFGVSLIIASLTVFFVDLENIWNFAVRLLWFGTPIFYTIENQSNLLILNQANPLYYFITAARDMVIYHRMPEGWIIAGIVISTTIAVVAGWLIFMKSNKTMAERI
jgi:ABC-type polysaccharide/polyol phosphate export permease